jgi:hypothetical protein
MAQIAKYPRLPQAAAAGGYSFTDPKELAEQRGVFWDVAKQLTSGIASGKFDLIKISFPVRLFEPRSYLQRICDGWCFLPTFMARAHAAKDPVERLRWVIAHAVGGLHNTCHQLKPFNPVLGETFQARYEDGTEVFLEQTSHHPPVTSWQVFGPGNTWKFYGYGEWEASFHLNSVSGGQRGKHYVEFDDGTRIVYNLPDMLLSGVMMGERNLSYLGKMTFTDAKNNLVCELSLPPALPAEQQSGWFGGWFAAKPPTDYIGGDICVVDGSTRKPVSKVEGSWLGAVIFDGQPYWTIEKEEKRLTPAPVENALPSDARFREDCVELAKGNRDAAQDAKNRIEEKQRRDRRLRAQRLQSVNAAAAAAPGSH